MATAIADAEHNQEERDNFFRLTLLLFRLGNSKLREYLKSQWPTVYLKANPGSVPTPWADKPADTVALKTISKPRFQFKDQEKIFDSGDTSDWDFTLLRLVLATYPLGFVIRNSAEDDALEEMRKIRNTLIGHAPDAKISNATFNTEWPKACNALGRFNATQDEFDAVEEDVKKPVDSLIPLLKECIKADHEMLTSIKEFEKKAEERHKELMETQDRHHDETINVMKEEGLSIRKAIEESSKPKSPEMRQLRMAEDQRRLLQERLPHYENDALATDLLDNLPCLTQEQKDQIAHDEKNYQTSKGVRTLVEKLEEHEEGFEQLVKALAKADLGHVAVILDPDFKNHVEEEEEEEDIPDFSIDGTAADTHILVRIWNTMKVRQWDLEERIASQFEKSSSSDSRKLRRYFEEELPQGVYFVHTTQLGGRSKNIKENTKDDVTRTKKDSVVFVFRVAKVLALDKLWEMYSDQILKEKLTEAVSRFLSKDPSENIDLELLFEEKNYMEKRDNLRGPESVEEPELSGVKGSGAELIDSDATGTETPAHSHRHLVKVYLDDSSQKELQLRDYQKELAAPALEGKNTIICAPTNSGKTFVAMEIAKRHLDTYKDCQNEARSHIRTPKVIFAVDKQNLVFQQRARFEEYLYDYNISDISGFNADRNSLDLLIKENDVVVLTAQILVNALIDKSVNIKDISLLLFDECHHTIGDGPYNMIMKTYLKTKLNENDNGNLPQVVGLTASLGVGQSNRPKEHILQMCANLDASNISTVRKNIEELTMQVTGGSPNRKVIPVNNYAQNVFELEVNKAMKEIEGFINERGTYCPPPSADRQSSGYRQWIENLSKHASIHKYSDMFSCGEHLTCYHEALLINNVVRIDDAMAYLENFSSKRDPTKLTDPKLIETDSWLRNVYQKSKQLVEKHKQEAPENPLLEALKQQIIGFHKKDSSAKGILFAQRRTQTLALRKWTEEKKELNEILKPDILVGSGDSNVGLSQSQQETVIRKFKNGDINIIIATTVAEEGLDISDCCYVIRYGVKTNEISSVQARGRIRAKDGNYVYIGDLRSRGADHELMNEMKEKMMLSVIKEVRDMDQELFSNEVKSIQIRSIREQQAKEEIEASKPVIQDIEGGATFYCKSCNGLVCHAKDMRLLQNNYRVVMDPSIFERSDIKQHKKPRLVDGVAVNKKIYCKKCDFDWGIVITVAGSDWPCLKVESFITELNETKERNLFKKWKGVPFKIRTIELEELSEARRRFMGSPLKTT